MLKNVFFHFSEISIIQIFEFKKIIYTLIISLIILGIFWYLQRFFLHKKIEKNIKKIGKIWKKQNLPNKNDPEFLQKLFAILGDYISQKYIPNQSRSHTSTEVYTYCDDQNICELYKNLESAIFYQKPLSEQEKILYQSQVQSIVSK